MTDEPVPTPPPASEKLARLIPLTYDAAQLAEARGGSERHVWRRHAAGELPAAVHIGRLVRWPRNVVGRWLADGCPPVRKTR